MATLKNDTKVSFTRKGKKTTGKIVKKQTYKGFEFYYIILRDGSFCHKRCNSVKKK